MENIWKTPTVHPLVFSQTNVFLGWEGDVYHE